MDSVEKRTVTPNKSRLARKFAKVLHIRAVTGVAPVEGIQSKSPEKLKRDHLSAKFDILNHADEKLKQRVVIEAFIAKLFATVSSAKSAYAQLQFAQSPYDVDGIQKADRLVVSELKKLSELRQCYVKKQLDDFSPEKTLVLAELQEQKSLLKTYEIMGKRLDYQLKLKDSEITFLKEKLEEAKSENKLLETRLNSSGLLFVPEKLKLETLTPNHFVMALRQTTKSIENFVHLLISQMELAGWDLGEAANKIVPGVRFWDANHKCFAFESFVCREMFDGFNFPNFSLVDESLPEHPKLRHLYFERFRDLKSIKTREYLIRNSNSIFAKFCYSKYLDLVHPKMEISLLGNSRQRDLISCGEYSDTTFFSTFAEMAKRVWLLHCLAFSYTPQASIFQVAKNCRFSEVYMESVNEEAFSLETDPVVAFTVVPGFNINKIVIQSQVYLS